MNYDSNINKYPIKHFFLLFLTYELKLKKKYLHSIILFKL